MGMKVEPSYKVVAYWDGLPVSLTLLKKIAPGLAREYRVRRKGRRVLEERTKRARANQEYAAAARVIKPQRVSIFSRLRSLISSFFSRLRSLISRRRDR